MKRISILSLVLVFAVSSIAFAHAGEVHTYLGTITKINADGSFVLKMKGGKDRLVLTSKDTSYTRSDNHAGKHELKVGRRVSAKISKDGKTALNVKMSAVSKAK